MCQCDRFSDNAAGAELRTKGRAEFACHGVCVCVCVRACARGRARARERACACVRARACVCVIALLYMEEQTNHASKLRL